MTAEQNAAYDAAVHKYDNLDLDAEEWEQKPDRSSLPPVVRKYRNHDLAMNLGAHGSPTLDERTELCLDIIRRSNFCEFEFGRMGVQDHEDEYPPQCMVSLKTDDGCSLNIYRALPSCGGYYISAHPYWIDPEWDEYGAWMIDNHQVDTDEDGYSIGAQNRQSRLALKRLWMELLKVHPKCRGLYLPLE